MALCWVNGEIFPAERAAVPALDPGFLYGEGCFETVRVHGGAPFRFRAHLSRMNAGMRTLGLEPPDYIGRVGEGAKALVEATDLREGLLRITATPPDPVAGLGGTVAITHRPLPTHPARVRLVVARTVLRIPGPLSGCKAISRIGERMALREAQGEGAFDALLLNPRGNVAETTARNLFMVAGGKVATPSLMEGALGGVTREAVVELATAKGLVVQEVPVALEELLSADEVFLTGGGVGVLAVASVQDRNFQPVPGPLTGTIRSAYEALLQRECSW